MAQAVLRAYRSAVLRGAPLPAPERHLQIVSGADARTVSANLGHSKTSTTLNLYAHTFDDARARASDGVGDLLAARKQTAKHA